MNAREFLQNPQLLSLPPIQESIVANSLEHYTARGYRYLKNLRCGTTNTAVLSYGSFCINEQARGEPAQQFGVTELLLCFNQLAYATFVAVKLAVNVSAAEKWTIGTAGNTEWSGISATSTFLRLSNPLDPEGLSAYLICKDFKVLEKSSRITACCSIKFQDGCRGSAIGEFETSVCAQRIATGTDLSR